MNEKLMTYAEAAERIGMSESWLRKQGALRTIPTTRFGRAVRFSEDDIRDIIAGGKSAPRLHPRRRRAS